jgi:hypothetical protein
LAKFVEFDPTRGVECWEDYTVDGKLQIHHRQDVEPLLDHTRMLRNDGLTDAGIKNDMWHYACIPTVVMLEWREKFGVDLFNKDHLKAVYRLLNTEYSYLKTTTKHHMASH